MLSDAISGGRRYGRGGDRPGGRCWGKDVRDRAWFLGFVDIHFFLLAKHVGRCTLVCFQIILVDSDLEFQVMVS